MFDKILVPLDGSEHSLKALDIAIQIAGRFKGKLTLIHVYSVTVMPVMVPEPATLTGPSVPIMSSAEISKIADSARDAGNRVLSDGEEKARAEGVDVEKVLVEGHVVHEIVRTAKEGEFDLVVIGARGRSKIRELLLGSVTDGVIHHGAIPVLVVK